MNSISAIWNEENNCPDLLSSPTVFIGVPVARYLVFCIDCCLSFCPLSLGHCVDLPVTASDYHFGIVKLSLQVVYINRWHWRI